MFSHYFDYSANRPLENTTPFTWGADGELNERILAALRQKVELFRKNGYEPTLSWEQEYYPTERSGRGPNMDVVERVRAEGLHALAVRGEHEKAKELEQFTPEQVLAFAVHEGLAAGDMQKHPIIQHRFGSGANGKPFQDPHQIMEANGLKGDPESAIYTYHAFLQALQQASKSMNFGIQYWKSDISFGLEDKRRGVPIVGAGCGEDPRGLRVLEGVLSAAHAAAPAFVKPMALEKEMPWSTMKIGPGRGVTLRVEKDRGELRVNHNPLAGDHMALRMLLVLCGMEYGLYHNNNDHYRQNVPKAEYVTKKMFDAPESLFFMREILNGAEIGPDGKLQPDGKYVHIYGSQGYLGREMKGTPEHLNFPKWFSEVRVREDNTIEWPPAALLEVKGHAKAPDEESLRQKLSQVTYGREQRVVASKGYTEIDPGYEHFTSNGETIPYAARAAHLTQMAHSPVLLSTLEPQLLQDIVTSLGKGLKLRDEHIPEVAEAFRGKFGPDKAD